MNATQLILRSSLFAAQKHAGQLRHGGGNIPYINHPIDVANRVAMAGGTTAAICAALLHDVMEDCDVKDQEILDLYPEHVTFGQTVLAIVKEHTDPPGMSWKSAKIREIEMMKAGTYLQDTVDVILADQLSNVVSVVENPPKWGNGEENDYIQQMKLLVDAGRERSPMLAREFDSAYEKAKAYYQMA